MVAKNNLQILGDIREEEGNIFSSLFKNSFQPLFSVLTRWGHFIVVDAIKPILILMQ